MKESKKQIYRVFTCADWGIDAKCIMCTTSATKLKSFIKEKIKDDTFGYNNYCDEKGKDAPRKTMQCKEFLNDFKNQNRCVINNKLNGGYYDYIYDGEEIEE